MSVPLGISFNLTDDVVIGDVENSIEKFHKWLQDPNKERSPFRLSYLQDLSTDIGALLTVLWNSVSASGETATARKAELAAWLSTIVSIRTEYSNALSYPNDGSNYIYFQWFLSPNSSQRSFLDVTTRLLTHVQSLTQQFTVSNPSASGDPNVFTELEFLDLRNFAHFFSVNGYSRFPVSIEEFRNLAQTNLPSDSRSEEIAKSFFKIVNKILSWCQAVLSADPNSPWSEAQRNAASQIQSTLTGLKDSSKSLSAHTGALFNPVLLPGDSDSVLSLSLESPIFDNRLRSYEFFLHQLALAWFLRTLQDRSNSPRTDFEVYPEKGTVPLILTNIFRADPADHTPVIVFPYVDVESGPSSTPKPVVYSPINGSLVDASLLDRLSPFYDLTSSDAPASRTPSADDRFRQIRKVQPVPKNKPLSDDFMRVIDLIFPRGKPALGTMRDLHHLLVGQAPMHRDPIDGSQPAGTVSGGNIMTVADSSMNIILTSGSEKRRTPDLIVSVSFLNSRNANLTVPIVEGPDRSITCSMGQFNSANICEFIGRLQKRYLESEPRLTLMVHGVLLNLTSRAQP